MEYRILNEKGEVTNKKDLEAIFATMWGPIVPVQKNESVSNYTKNGNNFLLLENKEGEAYLIGNISPRSAERLTDYKYKLNPKNK